MADRFVVTPKDTGDPDTDQWMSEVTRALVETAAAGAAASTEEEIVPVYATDSVGTDQSFILGSRNYVYYARQVDGANPSLPLPDGTVFIQFRGEQTRTVEISVHTLPSSFTTSDGITRNYTSRAGTDARRLAEDWVNGRTEIHDFPEDPDGLDFGYRSGEFKVLYARVAEASESASAGSQYADSALSRSFDYTWTRNGKAFAPTFTWDDTNNDDRDTERGYAFLIIGPADVVADSGRSTQFLCNIVQL